MVILEFLHYKLLLHCQKGMCSDEQTWPGFILLLYIFPKRSILNLLLYFIHLSPNLQFIVKKQILTLNEQVICFTNKYTAHTYLSY